MHTHQPPSAPISELGLVLRHKVPRKVPRKVHVLHYQGVPVRVCLGTLKEAREASYRIAHATGSVVSITTVEVTR